MEANDGGFEKLRQSVARLERQNRFLAVFSAIVGVALVLSAVLPTSTVAARRFTLNDLRTRQRAIWALRDGDPTMILQDAAGRWRTIIEVGEGGPEIRLHHRSGEPGVTLSALGSESALVLHDRRGRPRARISVSNDGAALEFLDAQGRQVAIFPGS